MVTVYGRETCSNCRITKRFLDEKGIEYEYVDIDNASQEVTDWIESKSFFYLPIVKTETDEWTGLDMVKLQAYAKGIKQ